MTRHSLYLLFALAAVLCVPAAYAQTPMKPTAKSNPNSTAVPFGATSQGVKASLYTIRNHKGVEATLTDFGATLVSLKTPDRYGKMADILQGYDAVSGYEKGKAYLGATIGRYGNRIAKARFSLDGKTYTLAANNGENSLHGGNRGFNAVLWKARQISPSAIEFSYTSADGEEGFPGELPVRVTFTLTDTNELHIAYWAKAANKNTVVNLTNHAYFNLSGNPGSSILDHELTLNASKFTPIDAAVIPTGELRSVKDTPFDFTQPTAIGARIDAKDEQLKLGDGYDHNWVLDRKTKTGLEKAAELYESKTGRVLQVLTTEPGVQFYSGNFLTGSEKGKSKTFAYRTGLCLETQHFPDSPNKPNFPSTELKAGQVYTSTTVLRFSTR